MNDHLGTVVIPVWNGHELLDRSILSALTSLDSRWQILVSDNNSSDETAEIIQKYLDNDAVKAIKSPVTLPVIAHWAFALSKVTSEFVCILAHDDEISTDLLASATPLLEGEPVADGHMQSIQNCLPDGTLYTVTNGTDCARVTGKSGFQRWPYFQRAFPPVNCIYGIWQTTTISSAFISATQELDLENPMSDRALASKLLASTTIQTLACGSTIKHITSSSIRAPSLREELVAYRQIVRLTNRHSSYMTWIRDQISGNFFFLCASVFAFSAAVTRPFRAPEQ